MAGNNEFTGFGQDKLNALNLAFGRTLVKGVYVNNAHNRKLGRVGKPYDSKETEVPKDEEERYAKANALADKLGVERRELHALAFALAEGANDEDEDKIFDALKKHGYDSNEWSWDEDGPPPPEKWVKDFGYSSGDVNDIPEDKIEEFYTKYYNKGWYEGLKAKILALDSTPTGKMSKEAQAAFKDVENGISEEEFYKKHKVGDYLQYKQIVADKKYNEGSAEELSTAPN